MFTLPYNFCTPAAVLGEHHNSFADNCSFIELWHLRLNSLKKHFCNSKLLWPQDSWEQAHPWQTSSGTRRAAASQHRNPASRWCLAHHPMYLEVPWPGSPAQSCAIPCFAVPLHTHFPNQIFISMCSSNTVYKKTLPAAHVHPSSSYAESGWQTWLRVFAVSQTGDLTQPKKKKNHVEGVKAASPNSRADWKCTQNHSFRVRIQSNLTSFKCWLPQSHLAINTPPPGVSISSCVTHNQPLQRLEDAKKTPPCKLALQGAISHPIGWVSMPSYWQEAKTAADQLKAPQHFQALQKAPQLQRSAASWNSNVTNQLKQQFLSKEVSPW